MVLFLISAVAYAEDPKGEALQSLTDAQNMIKQGQISKAVDEINYALSKLNEITAGQIINFIPDAPQGYTQVSKNSQGMGQGAAMVGQAGAEAEYNGPDESNVKVTIAMGGVTGKMGSLANLGSMFAGMGQDGGFKSIRIQGYTGTLQYDAGSRSGTLTIQVGEKSSVQVEGNNIPNGDVLKLFVNNMNLAKLASSF